MNTLLMRPYQGQQDLAAIAQLYNTCEAVDRLGYWTTVEDLQQWYSSPKFNPQRDVCLWEDNQKQLIGIGSLRLPESDGDEESFLGFEVHPQYRGTLEADILAWGIQHLQQMTQHSKTVKLRCGCRDRQQDRVKLLQDWGFVADRYFFNMGRHLTQPITDPQLPDGFEIRTVNGETEAEAWVEMFNQTFIDHWNHHDYTVEEYRHHLKSPDYRSDLDWVAVAADGTLAGFCMGSIYPYDNLRNGRQEGWIGLLGTRRGYRKLGLGRALLLMGMHRLKAAGMETALLGVDSQNPSGALRLYESVGFQKRHQNISFVKFL